MERKGLRLNRIEKAVVGVGATLFLLGADGARINIQYPNDNKIEQPLGEAYDSCDLQQANPEAKILSDLIQNKFGVQITTPKDVPFIDTYPTQGNRVDVSTVEWDRKSLLGLYKALCAVPTHLYSSRYMEVSKSTFNFATYAKENDWLANGLPGGINRFEYSLPGLNLSFSRDEMEAMLSLLRQGANQGYSSSKLESVPTRFILMQESFDVYSESKVIKAAGLYMQSHDSIDDTVILNQSTAVDDENYYLRVIVHELVHRVHISNQEIIDANLFDLLGVKDQEDFKKGQFKLKNKSKLNAIGEVLEEVKAKKSIAAGINKFLNVDMESSQLEYGNTNSLEFVSVGSEYYTYGRKTFLSVYSSFIGSERAGKFYELLKNDIFQGREY